ncbi:substrate-binding domain-containing protein [Ectothiorhodospiraceae bacterium WFHF3C12]|nr:substrate-binding domain-containing protein [Ectothiorhodospiraceae bacterium WFHF3C12]
MKRLLQTAAIAAASALTLGAAQAAEPIKIGHVVGLSGPLEPYAKQLQNGLEMGIEYATDGSNEVLGRKIEIITKDTQLKPDRARALLEEAYADDEVDLAVGPVSSGVALATLPIAQQYQKILIPQGVANSITGDNWNRYVFRVGRNSDQDAISNAAAIGKEGVCVATLAQDYAFGRDGVSAYSEALEARGGSVVHKEFVPTDTTDFTAPSQRLFNALKDRSDCQEKHIFVIWAGGGNPLSKIKDLRPERFDIQLATGGNILPALVAYSEFPGLEGATFYYYEHPTNDINKWLVQQHYQRFNEPPDFFTAQGMATGLFIVKALREAGSTDTEELIGVMEGMAWETPKGPMTMRVEDHQAMQPMYHFRIRKEERDNWFADRTVTAGVPELIRVIEASEMDIPVRNQ